MTDEKQKIEAGERIEVDLGEGKVKCGFNTVLGVPQLAYLPTSNYRPPVGFVAILPDAMYRVTKVYHSAFVRRYVIVELEEVEPRG